MHNRYKQFVAVFVTVFGVFAAKAANESWVVDEKTVFTDNFSTNVGLNVTGSAALEFHGATNTFKNLDIKNRSVLFSGVIRNPDGSISSSSPARTDASAISLYLADPTIPDASVLDHNIISNAIFEKSVYMGNSGGMQYRGLTAIAGTTNIFKGFLYTADPWHYLYLNPNSEMIIEGGATFHWTDKVNGGGRLIIRNKPITVTRSNLNVCDGTLEIACANNKIKEIRTETDSSRVEFDVDHAVTNTVLYFYANKTSTFDFKNTKQSIKYLICRDKGLLTGEAGSELEFTAAPKNLAGTTNYTNVFCSVTGALSLKMSGPSDGTLLLKTKAFASAGSLTVTNGTLELASGASWLKGTNFYAKGAGTLKFGGATQVNSNFAELHFSENGKVYIPENVVVTVKYAAIDGATEALVPSGDYTASTTGILANRIEGAGTLRVTTSMRPYSETTEDMTAQGDWTVTVDEGCTNVVKVAQTGSGKLVKNGKGVLVMTAAGSFTGGVQLNAGQLWVEAANALGTGEITVRGQCNEYSGICQLVLRGAGKAKDKVVALPNAIHFTGTTTVAYPGIYTYGHGSELSGKVTADQDLVFMEDDDFNVQEWPLHRYDMYLYCTALTFKNEVAVAGLLKHDGWCKYIFEQKVTANEFMVSAWRSGATNPNARYIFYKASEIGTIRNTRKDIMFEADDLCVGAALCYNGNSVSGRGNFWLNGHSQHHASIDGGVLKETGDSTWVYNYNCSTAATLTLTGSGEHECSVLLANKLSLVIDAADDFVQGFNERAHTMSGSITVQRGTLKVAEASTFKNVTAVTVNDKFIAEGNPFADSAVALTLGENAEFSLGDTATLKVASLTVGGVAKPKGIYLAANLPQLKRGRIYVDGAGAEGETVTYGGEGTSTNLTAITTVEKVNLVTSPGADKFAVTASGEGSITISEGGIDIAADGVKNAFEISAPTIVGCDQTWKIPLKKTLTFDNALKCVYGKVTVESPFTATVADRANLVFRGENTIDGALVVTATTVTVSGTLATPGHADQGKATKNGANTFTMNGYQSANSAYLVVSNAVIEKPLYACYSGNSSSLAGIIAPNNTTNAFNGFVYHASPWTEVRVGKNAEVVFAGGFDGHATFKNYGADMTGVTRIRGVPITQNSGDPGWYARGGVLSLEVAGNKIPDVVVGPENYAAKVVFAVDSALDLSYPGRLLLGYMYNNKTPGQFDITKYTNDAIVDLGSTCQQVNDLAGRAHTTITGNGARLEIMKQTNAGTKNVIDGKLYVASAIEGDVTLAMYGTGTLILTNQAFASTGALIVTNGTLRLESDASWAGEDIQIGGTGRLVAEGAIAADASLAFADSGVLEIPEGKTLSVKEVRVRQGNGWLSIASVSDAALAGHLAGAGTLNITGTSNVRRMALEWNVNYATGVDYTVEIDTNKIGSVGTGFAVYATTSAGEAQIPSAVTEGKREGVLALRFTVPEGTTALACEAGVGSLHVEDADAFGNLFAGALDSADAWTLSYSTLRKERRNGGMFFCDTGYGSGHYADYKVAVPESWCGKSVRLELDCQSKSEMVWAGFIRVYQYSDAAATTLLPEPVCDSRWTSHFRPPEKFVRYRDQGLIHPQAKAIKVRIELRSVNAEFGDDGLPLADAEAAKAKLLVSHLALWAGEELPFPKYDASFFTDGVSEAAGDKALVMGGDKYTGFFYATRGMASWANNTKLTQESQIFYPSGAGTVEAWFKPTEWLDENNAVTLFLGYSGNCLSNSQTSRYDVMRVTYLPSSGTFSFMIKDMDYTASKFTGSGTHAFPLNEWTHVALSWQVDGTAWLFVNGEIVASTATTGFKALDLASATYPNEQLATEFYFGCNGRVARDNSSMTKSGYPLFSGAADSLRVSTGARYTAAFTPAKRFTVDADTRALFDFDQAYDGVSGGGIGRILGSVRAQTDRVDHTLTIEDYSTFNLQPSTSTIQYYPAANRDDNDPFKVLELCNYPTLPGVENFRESRKERVWEATVTPNVAFSVTAPEGAVADFIEFRNAGSVPLEYPILMREGEIDPRSFADLKATMGLEGMSDKDKANSIFQYVLGASDYFMNHTAYFPLGSDVPGDVEYQALVMLNAYCGFECGPLNNMTANLFANVGNLPASQTAGYGHSFEQVFYDGKNHIYDLSAQIFFPSMDNETAEYLRESSDQPGSYQRIGRSPDHFIRNTSRGPQANSPEYMKKVAFVLNPGERFKAWYDNNAEQNDLQCNSSSVEQNTTVRKFNYNELCHATAGSAGNLWRIDRFFPHYGNGFLVFEGKPTADNPAFTVGSGSFSYSVESCYPIVAAEYSATLVGGGEATLSISTDEGTSWRSLESGKVRYPVRARKQYLVRVNAAIDQVANFRASTEVQINVRIFPGRIQSGENTYVLKAENSVPAEVKIGYRVPDKEIVISGGAYAGTIIGAERQFALLDPAGSLVLTVSGASADATASGSAGLNATLANGTLTVTASDSAMKGLGNVVINDGGAKKELTVLVSPNARFVAAADATVSGTATLLAADENRVQPCVNFVDYNGTAVFNFTELPAGRYAVMFVDRYMCNPDSTSSRMKVTVGSETRYCGSPRNDAINLFKANYGRSGRANFKWDCPLDPDHHSYPYNQMGVFSPSAAFSSITFKGYKTEAEGYELAAALVVPIDLDEAGDDGHGVFGSEEDHELYCDLIKVLCGLNSRPWTVNDAETSAHQGMFLILR